MTMTFFRDDVPFEVFHRREQGRSIAFVLMVIVPQRPFLIGSRGWRHRATVTVISQDRVEEPRRLELTVKQLQTAIRVYIDSSDSKSFIATAEAYKTIENSGAHADR